MYGESILEVDPGKIRSNLEELKKKSKAAVFAVLKANAYGLGALPLATYLEDGVSAFCVASPREALDLRKVTKLPILLLGYSGEGIKEDLIREGVSFAIPNLEEARTLDRIAGGLNMKASVHLALDTGHSRIGFMTAYEDRENFLEKIYVGDGGLKGGKLEIARPFDLSDFPVDRDSEINKESLSEIRQVYRMKNLSVDGVYSHFSRADEEEGGPFTLYQWGRFYNFTHLMGEAGLETGSRHIANDGGLLTLPAFMQLDAVRLGICLYGHYPSEYIRENTDLKLFIPYRWTSPIVHIKWIGGGVGVGYGQTWTAPGPRKIATIQVGYADGYSRLLSNKGHVLIGDQPCPIVGRVCMDQIMADITGIDHVGVGDRAVLMSEDYSADLIAAETGTISYEVLSTIGPRVERVIKERS